MNATPEVLNKLLKPGSNWKDLDYATLVFLGIEAQYMKDLPQRVLGKLVNLLPDQKPKTLKAFGKEIGVPATSLRIYGWIDRKFEGVEIPKGIPWTLLRIFAGTNEPEFWLKEYAKEPLSIAKTKEALSKGEKS